jgi:hypothetical protein
MATSTFSAAPINDTDAHFRAWGKGISDALAACGLTKSSDTGQIDWATVSKPGAGSTMQGYEIWKFTDSLQTTAPIYVKIQYGSQSTTNNPGLVIDIGHASDGAGNLTGITATQRTFGCSGSSSTAYSSFVSSDGGRINIAFCPGMGASFCFYIERTKDDNGAATGDGIDFVILGANGGTGYGSQQYLPAVGAPNPSTPNTSFFCASPAAGTGAYGTSIGLFPIFPFIGYAANPSLGALAYFSADIGAGGTLITVTMYGATHTFVTAGLSNTSPSLNGNSTAHSLAIRYE